MSPSRIIFFFGMWWQTFPQKMWVMGRGDDQDLQNKVSRTMNYKTQSMSKDH